jgi:hypothetical protein
MLQFYVEVASKPTQRHQRVTHERTANLGTGRTEPGPQNARTASERDAENKNENDNDGTGDADMFGSSAATGVVEFARNVRNRAC